MNKFAIEFYDNTDDVFISKVGFMTPEKSIASAATAFAQLKGISDEDIVSIKLLEKSKGHDS